MKVVYDKLTPIEIDHEEDGYVIVHRDHLNKFKEAEETLNRLNTPFVPLNQEFDEIYYCHYGRYGNCSCNCSVDETLNRCSCCGQLLDWDIEKIPADVL